jgi:1,4-dihydroxy-2-naphthoate octaprenyltransferase
MNAPVTRREVWVHMLLYPRHTLPTALAPVAVASALAAHDGVFAAGPAAAAFFAGWLVQLGGVITDNYNNLRRHGDDQEHPRFVEAIRTGVVTFRELRLAILAVFGVAMLAGCYLVWQGGLPVVAIGLLSIAAAVAYSTGPYPLGDRAGLGDPLFFVFFGLVSVMGTYYIEAASHAAPGLGLALAPHGVTWIAFVVSLPIAALCTDILVIDNIPTSSSTGRRTSARSR